LEYGYRLPHWLGDFYGKTQSEYAPVKKELLTWLQNLARTPEGRYSNWLWSTENKPGFLKPSYINEVVNEEETGRIVPDYTAVDKAVLDDKFLKNFEIAMFGGIKNTTVGEGNSYTELSDLDFRAASLLYYVQASTKDYARTPSLILADSSNSFNFNTARIPLSKGDWIEKDGKGTLSRKSVLFKSMQNIAMQEAARIWQARELLYNVDGKIKSVEQLKKEGVYTNLLEDFHYKLINDEVVFEKDGKPIGEAFKFHHIPTLNAANIFNKDGSLLNRSELIANTTYFNDGIESYINTLLSDGVTWYKQDTFEKFVKGKYAHIGNGRYADLITEMILNQFISNVEQQNFFSGTTAEFGNVLNTVKRIKSLVSPGRTTSPSGVSKVAIADDTIVSSKSLPTFEKLIDTYLVSQRGLAKNTAEFTALKKEILKDYMSINIGDGQAYITEHAYIKREKEAGRFKDIENIVETYNHPKFGLRYKFKDNLKLEDFVVTSQVKKFFVSDRKYSPTLNRFIEEQLKASHAVLHNRLIKGTELERINQFLQDNDIDEFITRSIKKEGLTPLSKISTNGDYLDLIEAGSLKVFEYDNASRRVQLDVPDAIIDAEGKFAHSD
jgi:hypothetical protein